MKRMTKRMIKGIMIIFFSVYLNAKENTEISKSTSGFSTSVSSVTIVDIDISTDVPVYEYVPKVIIEGKWGNGPGEFGASDPLAEEQYGIPMRPSSLAVNSKGEIYILDCLNNRIQKFNSEGKYLKSIEVPCASDENGRSVIKVIKYPSGVTGFDINRPAVIRGVNIVIDSKDTLYYYLERNECDVYEVSNRDERYGELTREHAYALWRDTYTVIYKLKGKKGEVWEIKDDKVWRKWEVGKDELPKKLSIVEVWYKKNNLFVEDDYKIELKDIKENEKEVTIKSDNNILSKVKLIHRKPKKSGEKLVLSTKPRIGDKFIVIPFSVYSGSHKLGDLTVLDEPILYEYTYLYKKDGSLGEIIKGVSYYLDGEGNGYNMEVVDNGVVVKKYEKVRVR